jgi:hypothetical protein
MVKLKILFNADTFSVRYVPERSKAFQRIFFYIPKWLSRQDSASRIESKSQHVQFTNFHQRMSETQSNINYTAIRT